MPVNRQTAQSYLNSLPQAEQQQVQASLAQSGSTLEQWFQAAVNAGDPRAVKAAGGGEVEGGGGAAMPAGGKSSDWLGKRKPTPSELRAYSQEAGWSEDFARFDDAVLADWIKNSWDIKGNKFKGRGGQGLFEKPTECPPGQVPSGPNESDPCIPRSQANPSQIAAAEAGPSKPTTFGQQLSYTGNPLTDMLLYQFNARTNLENPYANLFGLGEDRAPGGEGADADAQQIFGRALKGGGLFWSADESAVGDVNKAILGTPETAPRRGRRRGGGVETPSPAEIAAPPSSPAASPGPIPPQSFFDQTDSPMSRMLKGRGFGREIRQPYMF